MNQADLRSLAQDRVLDADALIKGGRWSLAYYVAGYAVECALKSCLLARMVHTGWVFQEKIKIDECLTHDFGKLINLAGLTPELKTFRERFRSCSMTLSQAPIARSLWMTSSGSDKNIPTHRGFHKGADNQ
jgi:HEPN domain-containing protein